MSILPVRVPGTDQMVAFEDAPLELLATDPNCWVLHEGDAWHGFKVRGRRQN